MIHDPNLAHKVEGAPSLTSLELNHAIRQALESAAKAVERLNGGRHYRAAFKQAARAIRGLKPE